MWLLHTVWTSGEVTLYAEGGKSENRLQVQRLIQLELKNLEEKTHYINFNYINELILLINLEPQLLPLYSHSRCYKHQFL